jgi:hypothetical protein
MAGALTQGFCGPVRLAVECNGAGEYEVRYFDKSGKPAKFSQSLAGMNYEMFDGPGEFVGDNIFNSDINWAQVYAPKAKKITTSKRNPQYPKKNCIKFWNNTGAKVALTF